LDNIEYAMKKIVVKNKNISQEKFIDEIYK
jgi:hypothetical protein